MYAFFLIKQIFVANRGCPYVPVFIRVLKRILPSKNV